MANGITRNDIPDLDATKDALLAVLGSGRARSFENIAGDVSKELDLSRAQRSYRIGTSSKTLFENRLAQARTELTKEGLIVYKAGRVKLVGEPSDSRQARKDGEPAEKPVRDVDSATVAPEGRPTKCLSFQQPFASFIATGVKDVEFRSRKIKTPIRNLVVCASKTVRACPEKLAAMPYGMAIGMVDVVDCVGVKNDHAWKLENPHLIKPFKVSATASFFYVADIPEVIPNNENSYRKFILPVSYRGKVEDDNANIASLFSRIPDEAQKAFKVDTEKWAIVSKRYPYTVRE